jgi:hypothetical protein
MRLTTIALPVVVLAAVGGSFAAGHYIGKYDAERSAMAAVRQIGADNSAQIFGVTSSIHRSLASGDVAKADAIAVRFAALQVSGLAECSLSKVCVGWVGTLMPSKAEMDAIVAAEASQRGK